jgi:glycerol-3-phosphate dehydrogenase (NAD(P)+)
MKNVYALICGIIDGVCKNTNTKAFVMTEGLSEMFVLGEKLGYSKDVFVGLSGLGDLLTTCMSEHSRNNRFGQMMAKGMDVQEAMDEMGMVVEGYYTTKVLKEWADEVGVELPLLNLLYEFLYEKMEVDEFMGKIINCGIFN